MSSNKVKKLVIATRKSLLAQAQATLVQRQLESLGCVVELLLLTTSGDRFLNTSLTALGGKGLFVKELEQALLNNQADLAVHSLKDIPPELPTGLCLPIILKRESSDDVLITREAVTLKNLPKNFCIGTASLRRQSQLLHHYPHLIIRLCRGNIDSRLKKLAQGEFDGIVLARAGLNRLKITPPHIIDLPHDICLPAAGQGAIALECRENDTETRKLLSALRDTATEKCIAAERECIRELAGDCKTPLAAFAVENNHELTLKALIATPCGTRLIRATQTGQNPIKLAQEVAKNLRQQGADDIIRRTKRLNQFTAIVTRPKEQATPLLQKLHHLGFNTLAFPTLLIQPLTNISPPIESIDHIIYISRPAVIYGHSIARQYPRATISAIGMGTKSECDQYQISCNYYLDTPPYNSETLLKQLNFKQGASVLLVKGNNGKNTLKEGLLQKGVNLFELAVYERLCPTPDPALYQEIENLSQEGILISTSLTSLQNFIELTRSKNLRSTLSCIVITEDMRQLAEKNRFSKIILAKSATDEDIVQAMETLL